MQIDVFMYVTCLEQQSFCHAVREKSKIQTALFSKLKECYPAENKQADGNLCFLSCDEDKSPKLWGGALRDETQNGCEGDYPSY